MAHSWRYPPTLVYFLLCLPGVYSQAFDCKVSISGQNYDLAELYGEHTISRSRVTPPTTIVDTIRFDLCEDLVQLDGVAERDQCPAGTRACLTKTNQKANEPDRIVSVVPIAQTDILATEWSALTGDSKGISLILHGPSWPKEPSPGQHSHDQSLSVRVICPPNGGESQSPSLVSHQNGQWNIDWLHRVACPRDESNPGGGDENGTPAKSTGSGVGWFFLVLLLAFLTYFALGAYYNYNHYGATGWDLVPHRDFWRDVPFLIRDVVSHLCTTLRPRGSGSGRGGYVAV
ncbi:hypothetical protein SISNIDRAFT_448992 [Sistotremastrum niveocremeum HHB9708]|uniref:Autophagy-related protein 27 n=2 Tax=Sistotremastraceae TaxID=3402574 RepID=A0A165AAB5_9AGAM|nr:hypothetical protein SISNIDRAFT_448992 [Sistotremastrum niveocremeum HHB9708]KZT42474.1 hypothetical protein SISSUDRAFT_1041434 [Sistotremastrum suecicum HHB10207 ss-3]